MTTVKYQKELGYCCVCVSIIIFLYDNSLNGYRQDLKRKAWKPDHFTHKCVICLVNPDQDYLQNMRE